MNLSVADTDEEARTNFEKARDERNAFRDVFVERNSGLSDAIPVAEELGQRNPGGGDPHVGGGNTRATLIGNPDTVAKRLQQLSDWGIGHVLLRFSGEWAGATKSIAESSMRLFNNEVMPRFANQVVPRLVGLEQHATV